MNDVMNDKKSFTNCCLFSMYEINHTLFQFQDYIRCGAASRSSPDIVVTGEISRLLIFYSGLPRVRLLLKSGKNKIFVPWSWELSGISLLRQNI